jgi:type II secretory pathway pseudopilin PulG
MKRHPLTNGVTIIETMVVLAIMVTIGLALTLFFSHSAPIFQKMRVRQQVMMESRACMDAILERLRNGKARSLIISTPPISTAVPYPIPNSRVDFVFQTPLTDGATAYLIYFQNNTVYAQEFIPNHTMAPKLLASNVSGLMFTGDSSDPGIVGVTLRIDRPLDASNDPSHVSTLILPNHIVHLVEST